MWVDHTRGILQEAKVKCTGYCTVSTMPVAIPAGTVSGQMVEEGAHGDIFGALFVSRTKDSFMLQWL